MKRSLSWRFSVALIGVVSLILAGFTALLSWKNSGELVAELTNRMQLVSVLAQKSLPLLIWEMNTETIEEFLTAILSDEQIVYVSLLNENEIIATKAHPDVERLSWEELQSSPAVMTNSVEIHFQEKSLATFRLAASTTNITQTLQMRIFAYLALMGLLMLSILITSILITRHSIQQPLARLGDVMAAIANGELMPFDAQRFSKHNEIGRLAQAFQKMLGYLRNMAEIATRIADGNLDHTIVPRSERDVLGLAFRNMTIYLQEMATVATTIAEGDLRREVSPKTNADMLGLAFQRMNSLRDVVHQIMQGSERLGQASQNLSTVSAQMASGAEQTSQQAHFVSSNSQKISQNVTEISSATEQLAASIREISHKVLEIESIVMRSVETANSANATIIRLKGNSQEIGEIVKVITTITQQTNLLALNAGIEAARVGEAGRGFAVVANEIKELARETARSAEGIIRKIETIQANTAEASRAISQVTAVTQQVHELSLSVATAIEEQAATTNTISHNVADTADGSSEITRTITEVANVISQTSEQASSVQSAVEELTGLAEQLRQLVGKFQV